MSNLIQVFENSLSHRVCDNLINRFENDINISKGRTIGGYNKAKKTVDLTFNSTINTYLLEYYNVINNTLVQYISEYKKITNNNLPINLTSDSHMIMRYLKNEGIYTYHHDFYAAQYKVNGYCRILTYIFYLNTIDIGGETEFIDGTKIKPEKGKLLIFPATWTFVHKGNIPESSNKYILTGWLLVKSLN